MTPLEAVQVLADATEPSAVGKISRSGYALIEQALQVLKDLAAEKEKERP